MKLAKPFINSESALRKVFSYFYRKLLDKY